MKATLKFNLDDSDDSMAHLRAVKSLDMAFVLWELVMNTKKQCYYATDLDPKATSPTNGIDVVFSKLYDLLEEHDVNVDSLIR